MSKTSKKTAYDAKRAMAVKKIADDFKVTDSYVRQCINGTVSNPNADEIKKAYNAFYSKLENLS